MNGTNTSTQTDGFLVIQNAPGGKLEFAGFCVTEKEAEEVAKNAALAEFPIYVVKTMRFATNDSP
jgi:hypothetical protein